MLVTVILVNGGFIIVDTGQSRFVMQFVMSLIIGITLILVTKWSIIVIMIKYPFSNY